MKKRQATNKLSFLISLLLLIQVLFPAANVFAAETNNNMLPPSNLTYELLTPTDVKLTWSAVFGATGYKVYEITDGQLITRGTSTTTSFTINSLPEGSYTYVVSTLSPDGESGPCAPITINITYPDMTAPTLTHTIQNGNDIILSWGASPNAQSYNLYQVQADGQTTLLKTLTARTYTITNSPAGTYTYAVNASNSVFGESPLSAPLEVAIVYPTLTAPGNFTFTITNISDVNLKWNAANYASNYKVYQIIEGQKVLKSTVTGTTFSFTKLPAGDYVYEVYSYSDRFGESAEGSRVTATVGSVAMAAPGNLAYKLQNVNDIVLTWNTVTYATGYKIYQVTDGQKELKSTVTGTTVTFTNQPAGDYAYEVHSFSDRFGESAEGSQLALTLSSVTMAPPGSFTYKLQNLNDIVLTWGTAANANSYKVYQIIDGQKELISTVTGTTVTYTNQPAGDYVYEVHSFSTRFGESIEGSKVTFTLNAVTMEPPSNFTYKLQNLNDIVLTWGIAANANSYKVYQIIDGQKVLKSTVTGTTVTYTNQPADDYVYEVHSVSTRFGESPEGSLVTLTLEAVIMAAPGNFQFKLLNGNDIALSWDTVENANSYKVYQITNGQKVLKSTVNGTTVNYTNQPQGNYTYEVYSFATRFGQSQEGSQVSFPLIYPTMEPPINLVQTIKNPTDFTLTWDASAFATSYKVYQIVNGQKVLKSTVTGQTVTYTGMPPGDYTYEVHSVSTRFGESPEGTKLMMTLNEQVMQAPANPTYSITNGNDITLKWTTVSYATSYKIYQVVDGQKILKSTVPATTVTYTNQLEGTLNYVIHSSSTIFGESPEGTEVTFILDHPTVAAPNNVAYKILNGNDVVLTWGAVSYANSYKVYEIIDGQKVLKNSVTTLTATYSNVNSGDHTYIVHALSNRFGESPVGSELDFTLVWPTMQVPGGFTQSVANGNDIRLRWNPVTYATEYRLYQLIDGQEVLVKSQTGTTITFTNQPEGDYTYVVRSYSNRFGESPEGSKLDFTLVWPTMQAPGGFTQSIANGNDITLKWNPVTYATEYKLYQLVNGQEVLVKTQTGTTVTFINQPEGDYTYVVRSYSNRFGESPEGSKLDFTLVWPTMQAPGGFTQSVANGNDITLKWNPVTYATEYKLYQLVNGQEVLVKTQTGTTFTFINQPEGDYNYVVHSYSNRFGESPEGSKLEFALVWPVMQAPGGFTQSVANGNDITLKWNPVTYGTVYKLYRLIDGQEVLVKTQTGTTITFINQPEGDYTYVMRSYSNRFGESPAGSKLDFKLVWPVMQAPGNLTKTISNGNDIALKWNTVAYATAYRVYQVVDGQKVLKSTLTGTTVSYINMPAGDYSYEVHSYNDRFGESPIGSTSNFALVWPVVLPPVLTGSLFNVNNITLSWSAVTWANEYRVYDLTGGTRQLIYKGTALSFKVYNLSEDTHHYEVTAYSTRFGESASSNQVTETIVFPVMQPPVASLKLLSSTSAQITWSFVTYANGYNVYELIDGKPVLLTEKLNNLSYTVSNLSYKNHEYIVTSFSNSFGGSEPSNTVLAKLIVDTEAPVTKVVAFAGWTNQSQIVTLSATDNETGVANTFYSLNNGEYTAGTSVKVEKEGVNKVSYYSVDKVGNIEAVQIVEVRIDQTAPVTSSNASDAWSRDKVEVDLLAADAGSGAVKTYHSINGSDYQEGTSFTVDNEGINGVSFYSIDQAGNKEAAHMIEVKIDHTAPVTVSNAPTLWVKEAAVYLTATDAHSGIVKTYYSVNDSGYQEGTSFAIDNEGVNEVSFYSVDQAGNKEAVHKIEVKIDRTAPVTVSDAPAVWSKEDVTVKLTALDTQSGTAQTFYSIDDSAYSEGSSFTVSDEGIHKVTFYSVDMAGNIETANTAMVKIDKTAPVIKMSYKEEYQSGTTLQLTYSAVDTLSGIVTDEMTITRPNGATEDVERNSGIVLDKPGVYTVTVNVTNAAGLSTTLTKQFVVYIKASIAVTPNVIKGNKGVFTVRADLPNGYSSEGFDLNTVTLNGVKALNSNNGYYNQAKLGQFKFERSDFNWTAAEVTLHLRAYVNGILVIGETIVKVQK